MVEEIYIAPLRESPLTRHFQPNTIEESDRQHLWQREDGKLRSQIVLRQFVPVGWAKPGFATDQAETDCGSRICM